MEKVIITSISQNLAQPGKDPFWGVELDDGRKATVWDGQIAADIGLNLNWPTMAEVKLQGKYLNIREFKAERKAGKYEVKTTQPEVQATVDAGKFNQEGAQSPSEAHAEQTQENIETKTSFEVEAKSSVKLKKMAKGMQWEVKVVKGEESLTMGLMEAAVVAHKALLEEFPEVIKEDE